MKTTHGLSKLKNTRESSMEFFLLAFLSVLLLALSAPALRSLKSKKQEQSEEVCALEKCCPEDCCSSNTLLNNRLDEIDLELILLKEELSRLNSANAWGENFKKDLLDPKPAKGKSKKKPTKRAKK